MPVQDSGTDHRVAVHECGGVCGGGGIEDDCLVSSLNGWIKGWQVPLADTGNSGENNRFYTDGVTRKCLQH